MKTQIKSVLVSMLSIILAVLSITFCAFGTGAPVETNEALVRNVSLEKSQINLE